MSSRPIDPETGNPISVRDIAAYDATIVRANVAPGTKYWKIVDAYHLSGQQNKGNHNIYVDMLNADGSRRNGAHCNLYFSGDKHNVLSGSPRAVLTIDKPATEPGTNAPMFRGTFYAVEGADMPSDKATGFNSEWPDEEAGNTNGHHSFMVIFQEAMADGTTGVATGAIRGSVSNGAGRSINLSGNNVNVTAPIGADGSFGFDNVAPGTYTLTVVGTNVTASVLVSAGQQANISLTLPTGGTPPGNELENLKQQIAQLQQQLEQANSERVKLSAVLAQIKQALQNAGM